MTLDAIRCFCAVIEYGSFRQAADRVHRSQPAVTQQIKALELELGQLLVDRKTVSPTPAGIIFYQRGLSLIQGAESLEREIADFDELEAQDLVVGTSDTNALYFLPSHVRAFSLRMPQIRLVVRCASSEAIADDVRHGDLDLGIVSLSDAQKGLESRTLFEQKLVLVAPASHALSSRKRIGLGTLRKESFVLIHDHTRTGKLLGNYFAEHNFEPQRVMDSGSFEVIKQYVAAGVGLSFIPEMVLRPHDYESISVIRMPGLPSVSIGAVWRTGAYQTKAARAFLDEIGAEAGR